jgi:predicted enzyme involved in methoxymalonyl-ACP biosynthesis
LDYQVDITKLPTMIVFEEEKFYKKIEWEENILKLVKSFNLDINALIEKA